MPNSLIHGGGKPHHWPRILWPVCSDQKSVVSAIASLAEKADFQPGDRVKTLKGSVRGTILRVLPDGRVVWQVDAGAELTGLPESLIREKNK